MNMTSEELLAGLADAYRARILTEENGLKAVTNIIFESNLEDILGNDPVQLKKEIIWRQNDTLEYMAKIADFYADRVDNLPMDDKRLWAHIWGQVGNTNVNLLAPEFMHHMPTFQAGKLPIDDVDFDRRFMFFQVHDILDKSVYVPYVRQGTKMPDLSAIEIYTRCPDLFSQPFPMFDCIEDPAALGNSMAFNDSANILKMFGLISQGLPADEVRAMINKEPRIPLQIYTNKPDEPTAH